MVVQEKFYTAEDLLDGGDVLPGFSVKLSEIFAVLGPVSRG
jgi:hypothetical protein